jgi:hypothetical protein
VLNELLKATGDVSLVLRDETGKVIQSTEIKNLVVTAGLGFIASRMKDTTATAMSHMAVGTDNTAAALGNTTLGAEVGSSRTSLTSTTVSTNTIQYACTFGAGVGTGALTEAGIFNASSGGTMLCRTVFSAINKAAGDSLTITWTITIS